MRLARLLAGVLLSLPLAAAAAPLSEEPFPPKGYYINSVHRFFPDLDSRLNAVRYGRWRAIEIAWAFGINTRLDRDFSSYLLTLLENPPRFAPEADRVAPRFAREAVPVFRTLRWGQVFEQGVLDVLASSDATPRIDEERLRRLHSLYRREPWALSEPPDEVAPVRAMQAAPVSARILLAGTRLFALAAEDLAASDFGQQRWRVKKTVEEFDHSFAVERSPEQSTYRLSAPTLTSHYAAIAESLDRLARFRGELFEALVAGGDTRQARRSRDERVKELARRWGIPVEGIGGR
jgi:hypothetical protein